MDSTAHRIRQVLLGMRMLAEGNIARTGNSTISEPGHRVLWHDGQRDESWYARYRQRFEQCRTPDDVRMALAEAEHALDEIRSGVKHTIGDMPRELSELRWWVVRHRVGARDVDVAVETGMSLHWVHKVRNRAGKNPKDGS